MPKKRTKKSALEDKLLKNPVLIVALAVVIMLLGYFGTQKFLDWQNRNMIEGMAEDFPVLIAGVEEAISYPLEITSECLQTQEKFSEGVSLCGLTVGLSEENSENINFDSLINYLETQELGFKKAKLFDNKKGYEFSYKSKNACMFRYEEYVYLDCAFGIREANKPLAAELFSEEALNARKNELLNQ